jgi:hypothetical protein
MSRPTSFVVSEGLSRSIANRQDISRLPDQNHKGESIETSFPLDCRRKAYQLGKSHNPLKGTLGLLIPHLL